MKYINDFSEFSINENSKNDPIQEINTSNKLGIILLGTPGVGKCMEYKTPILVNDNLIEIGKLIEDNIPTDKVGLDLLEIFITDIIRPIIERDERQSVRNLRILTLNDSTDEYSISVNWTGTITRLDEWVRTYDTNPSKTIVIKISDIVSRQREYRLNTLLENGN